VGGRGVSGRPVYRSESRGNRETPSGSCREFMGIATRVETGTQLVLCHQLLSPLLLAPQSSCLNVVAHSSMSRILPFPRCAEPNASGDMAYRPVCPKSPSRHSKHRRTGEPCGMRSRTIVAVPRCGGVHPPPISLHDSAVSFCAAGLSVTSMG
jgi:hypothetical protein